METQFHPDGFIMVWDGVDSYHVGGMVGIVRRERSPYYRPNANDTRPSCSCRDGHREKWCAHKDAAYEAASLV